MWTKELEKNTREADSYMGGITVGEIRGEARGIKKGIAQGIEQGIEQGIAQGIEMEKSNMITRMNARNIPIEVISDTAEMPVSKVLEIIEASKTKVA